MSWIQNECGRAVRELRGQLTRFPEQKVVHAYFERGFITLTPSPPVGMEKAYPLRAPIDRTDAELVDWLYHFMRGLPCCPKVCDESR